MISFIAVRRSDLSVMLRVNHLNDTSHACTTSHAKYLDQTSASTYSVPAELSPVANQNKDATASSDLLLSLASSS